MNYQFTRGAIIAGSTLLAATLLTGCGGEKHTFSGMEVSSLEKTITALDAAWAQHKANAKAANVDENSRCFVQTDPSGTLAEKALCGPVRYLGDDETAWDSVKLNSSPDGKDKVTLSGTDSWNNGQQPNANTTLYRTDGKKAQDNAHLEEPDTKAADPGVALWGAASSNTNGGGKTATVITPDGQVGVTGARITDRVGSASNRFKAGEGYKFATVTIDTAIGTQVASNTWGGNGTAPKQPKTELALIAGGKSYPIGKPKSGTMSMSLPGDGKDAALAVTYDGLTQTVTLADTVLHTTATVLYDNQGRTGSATSSAVQVGKDFDLGTVTGRMAGFQLKGTRGAYDDKAGWAPEGKAWLNLTGNISIEGPKSWYMDGLTPFSARYDGPTTVKSSSVTNVTGSKFDGELKANNSTDVIGGISHEAHLDLLYLVPSNASEFTVALSFNAAGNKPTFSGYANAAPTASVDLTVPPMQLSLKK